MKAFLEILLSLSDEGMADDCSLGSVTYHEDNNWVIYPSANPEAPYLNIQEFLNLEPNLRYALYTACREK